MPHGIANSILLPYVMEYNLISCLDKFKNVASLMGKKVGESAVDDAVKAIDAVKELKSLLPIPQSLGEYGLEDSSIDYIAECAMNDGNFGFNPRSASKEDIVNIIKTAM